jgi:hypothetical protein
MATATSGGSTNPAESNQPLSSEELRKMNAYWRAANYLSVGQIYLYANPLLLAHIKPRLLGHWSTTPGLNFIYVQRQDNTALKRRALSPSPFRYDVSELPHEPVLCIPHCSSIHSFKED